MAKLVLVMFYKNVSLILAQIFWSVWNGYSGQKFYYQLAVEAYNLVFTALPIMLLAAYDRDIPQVFVLKYPQLYDMGLHSELFNMRVFWRWVTTGIYHALWCLFVPVFLYMSPMELDLWMLGALVLTSVITIANIKIMIEQGAWHWSNAVFTLLTLISWPAAAFFFNSSFFIDQTFGWEWYGTWTRSLARPDFWFALVLTLVGSTLHLFWWKAAKREFFPESRHIVLDRVKMNGWFNVFDESIFEDDDDPLNIFAEMGGALSPVEAEAQMEAKQKEITLKLEMDA